MSEVFLAEEDEDRLKRAAVDKVFLAILSDYIESSQDPFGKIEKLRKFSSDLASGGTYSENPDINSYCQNYTKNLVDAYFDQLKIVRG